MDKPKVTFDRLNIWRRLECCQLVAAAHGWPHERIHAFNKEVAGAFSYEEAMAVINREFDVMGEN